MYKDEYGILKIISKKELIKLSALERLKSFYKYFYQVFYEKKHFLHCIWNPNDPYDFLNEKYSQQRLEE